MRPLAGLRDETGMTLPELLVAVAIGGVVTILVATNLLGIVRVSASVEQRTAGVQDLRTALEILERDLRAANPIDAIPTGQPVSTYDTELAFSVYCSTPGVDGCGSDRLREISYRVVGNGLERTVAGVSGQILGPTGPAALPVTSQRGAVVNAVAQPVFRYFDGDGVQLDTSGATAAPPSQFRNCVKEVRVHLEVVTESRSTGAVPTAQLETGATIRNFHEVPGC